MPFGAEVTEQGVRFSIWAPAAREARLHVDGRELAMQRDERGFFATFDETARAGSRT